MHERCIRFTRTLVFFPKLNLLLKCLISITENQQIHLSWVENIPHSNVVQFKQITKFMRGKTRANITKSTGSIPHTGPATRLIIIILLSLIMLLGFETFRIRLCFHSPTNKCRCTKASGLLVGSIYMPVMSLSSLSHTCWKVLNLINFPNSNTRIIISYSFLVGSRIFCICLYIYYHSTFTIFNLNKKQTGYGQSISLIDLSDAPITQMSCFFCCPPQCLHILNILCCMYLSQIEMNNFSLLGWNKEQDPCHESCRIHLPNSAYVILFYVGNCCCYKRESYFSIEMLWHPSLLQRVVRNVAIFKKINK